MTSDVTHFDVAVLGGGSAGESLARELADRDANVVVFEPGLVGGECPFYACMPTKAMLHDAAAGRSWRDAVRRRNDVVDHLDDTSHVADLTERGVTVVRSAGRLADQHTVTAGDDRYRAEHIVLATGAEVTVPPIDGIDGLDDRLWTSADAMTTPDRPTRLTILGGGVIGCELATIFSRFGTEVHLLDAEPRAFPDLPTPIGEILDDSLRSQSVRIRRGVNVERVSSRGAGVRVQLDNAACLDTDRLLVATGTGPRTHDLGLESIGVDPERQLPVDDAGRVRVEGSVWAIGDVAGRGEYTHLANHHAAVVADALTGRALRRFDEVVTPACVFTDPPILTIGPLPESLDDDVIWVEARLDEIPRAITDQLDDGYLTIAVHRHRRSVVAAHGIGAGFDILASALVTAIDGEVPVDRLARSMYPFPTIGEILGVIYPRAVDSLGEP